jgi:hypothetical protein
MVFKKHIVVLIILVLAGCSSTPKTTKMSEDQLIIGLWAMLPIDGFVTYVKEYKANGEIYSHGFVCQSDGSYSTRELEKSTYNFIEPNRLAITTSSKTYNLKLRSINQDTMQTTMELRILKLDFEYVRTDKIEPMCNIE